MRSFMKIKPSKDGEITLSFTDIHVVKSCPSREIFIVANILLNAIRENKILAKIFGFTVLVMTYGLK